jgi:ABC-type multidrug transport system fused ATPase/permease subunit
MTTFLTISIVGGPQFLLFIIIIGLLYWNGEWFSVRTITDILKCSLQSFEGGSQQHMSTRGRNIRYYSKQIYGQTSRDLRRLGMSTDFVHPVHRPGLTPTDSVTRSPLYSIYGETISGVTIIRAFGASSKFLRDMLKSVDTVRFQRSSEKRF